MRAWVQTSPAGAPRSRPTLWLSDAAARIGGRGAPRGGAQNGRALRVEIVAPEAAAALREDWRALAGRALEPNVFLEPGFAIAAAQHFTVSQKPRFLLVWRPRLDGTEALIGLAAFEARGALARLAQGWRSKFIALGAPLLDADRAAEAFDAMMDHLARETPACAGALFPSLLADGPVARLIAARAEARGLSIETSAPRRRAALVNGAAPGAALSLRHAKELRRQHRRLAEVGALRFVSETSACGVREACERFLALEAAGWKAKAGTALLCDPAAATFTRAMTRQLAQERKCRIDALELDGAPIAMGVVLISNGVAALWKIAYDERLAAYSPGVRFVLEFSARQSADPAIAITDSCAMPDHPMIDRLWADRIAIVDIAVAAAPRCASAFLAAMRRRAWRDALIVLAKRLRRSLRMGRRA